MNLIIEKARCAKHNVFDRNWFKVFYRGGLYHVQTRDGVRMKFGHNPYLAFREIGGYLRGGEWPLEAGMQIVDAGAYPGEFALYASSRVGPQGAYLDVGA